MKRHPLIIALILASPITASAEDSRIAMLCGVSHSNELASPGDARANPAGYYVASLKTQLPLGDPRIVATNDDSFHLCTRSSAMPDMDTNKAILLINERTIKYLFVPRARPEGHFSG